MYYNKDGSAPKAQNDRGRGTGAPVQVLRNAVQPAGDVHQGYCRRCPGAHKPVIIKYAAPMNTSITETVNGVSLMKLPCCLLNVCYQYVLKYTETSKMEIGPTKKQPSGPPLGILLDAFCSLLQFFIF